jgi:hypothetical protein
MKLIIFESGSDDPNIRRPLKAAKDFRIAAEEARVAARQAAQEPKRDPVYWATSGPWYDLIRSHRRRLAAAALIERHANPPVLTPDNMTTMADTAAADIERDLVRYTYRARDLDRGSDLGDVTDCAINPGPIELNRSGFEHAMSKHGTSIVHAPGFTLQVLEPGERQHQNVLESETIR